MFIEPGPGWMEYQCEKAVKKRLLRRRVRGAFRMVPQPAYSAGGMPGRFTYPALMFYWKKGIKFK